LECILRKQMVHFLNLAVKVGTDMGHN
jgi:hypothetical protein